MHIHIINSITVPSEKGSLWIVRRFEINITLSPDVVVFISASQNHHIARGGS